MFADGHNSRSPVSFLQRLSESLLITVNVVARCPVCGMLLPPWRYAEVLLITVNVLLITVNVCCGVAEGIVHSLIIVNVKVKLRLLTALRMYTGLVHDCLKGDR